MRTFHRIVGVLTLVIFMSGATFLTVKAAAQDNQNYDSQAADADQAMQPDPDDQQPAVDETQEAPNAGAPANSQPAETEPPARAARLQYMSGSVSVQPQGTGDWVAGEVNRPLTNSDNVWADKNSRAEISVGTGLIRIGSETSLTLTNIGEDVVQLQLHQGAMNVHVRRLYDNEKYEIDTPNQAFTVLKPGDYRFDVNPDTDKTVITVWRGEGESTGDGPAVHLRENQQARFSNGTSMTVDTHGAPAPDSFDEWAQARDGKLDNSASSRYVSPGTVGYEDLDEYGTWKQTGDYGPVWYPAVAPGWAPYYYGHWVWENPWGWSWVEYEPWGFAPFHYGRWVFWGGAWGWAPGPVFVRPFYAPALVAWFGGGWGFHVGVGIGGGFGWCPLGWGEPFIPWYGVSRAYFFHVNFTNGRFFGTGRFGNLNTFYRRNFVNGRFAARNGFALHYANLHRPGGFTAISRNTLVNSLPVSHNNIRVSPAQMSRATAVHSLRVAPTRASIAGSTGARAAVPSTRSFSRPVVSRMAAPNRSRSFNSSPRAASNIARPGLNSNARPGFNSNVQRPMSGNAGRGTVSNNSRGPAATMGSRGVPRPPNAGSFGNPSAGGRTIGAGSANGRFSPPQMASRNNVPRPPSAGMTRNGPSSSPRGGGPGFAPRGGAPAPRQSAPRSSGPPRSQLGAPRSSASGRAYQNYGPGSYGRSNSPYYGGGRSSYGGGYSRPQAAYGGGNYGRSMPSPGGYSRASSAPGFGGGGRMGSFGGGGHASSGGGGHFSGGGGGGHMGGGGGGHAGGGGGGGRAGGGGGGGHGGHR
ncbi:MAG: hypothetical protein J2P13_00040 [Acidobacteria bacterium]|nr:hypothetical protein [Acidobacteriota bacterium]